MGLFTESEQDRFEREREESKLKLSASKMTDEQLILAMILEIDSADNQILAEHPFGIEASKRCGYNPYI